jgi:MFS family permease
VTVVLASKDKQDEPVRLARNRNYNVLWLSVLLSELAGEVAFIAFPLLILAQSGSAVQVGLITSVLAASRMAANLPAGVLADRFDRKRIMLLSQLVRSAAMLSIVVALSLGSLSLPHIVLVAMIDGALSSVFEPAEHAALAQVVPPAQLTQALTRNSARPFAALLIGPALAGFTFGLHELAPFSVDAGFLAVSFAVLSLLRLPRDPSRDAAEDEQPAAGRSRGGIRWLLRQPLISTTVVWIVLVTFALRALVVTVLVMAGESDVGYGEIGLIMACFGAGGLLGAVLAGWLRSVLAPSVIVIGSSWVFAALTVVIAVVPRGLALGPALGLVGVLLPVASATIVTAQLTLVPDGVRGRLTGMVGLCADLAGTVGPIAGGVLVATAGNGATGVLGCAAVLGVTALGATLSPVFRRFPSAPRS